MKVVFLFVDGLGVGSKDPTLNPCAGPDVTLFSVFENGAGPIPIGSGGWCVPTDANLGVEGLPQSATGQTTLFTGSNAAALLGRHLPGFPNPELRGLLAEKSILKQIREAGRKPVFLNAFRPRFFELDEATQWRLSATTVGTLAAGLDIFNFDDLASRRALYHDITNETIDPQYGIPRFSLEEASGIVVNASAEYDFVLFEYFMTDRIGHTMDLDAAHGQVLKLERFLTGILRAVDLDDTLVLVTSDHGNIEDMGVKTHTRNPAMTCAWGRGAEDFIRRVSSLEDIAPAVLHVLET